MGTAWLALTAETGDQSGQVRDALARLEASPGIRIVARSASGPAMVIGIETGLKPVALLDLCQAIELGMGRVHRAVWAPRSIDIDIIAFDDFEIRSPRLTLPHPFAHQRDFVLTPLREIAPQVADWVVTVNTKPR